MLKASQQLGLSFKLVFDFIELLHKLLLLSTIVLRSAHYTLGWLRFGFNINDKGHRLNDAVTDLYLLELG